MAPQCLLGANRSIDRNYSPGVGSDGAQKMFCTEKYVGERLS